MVVVVVVVVVEAVGTGGSSIVPVLRSDGGFL